MEKAEVELVVPHPETGEPMSVDAAMVEEVARDGSFTEILEKT